MRPLTSTLRQSTAVTHWSKPHHHHRRTFIQNLPNPFGSSEPSIQTLTASRVLPYPSSAIYAIIADVSSYQRFLPFCLSSRVTRWSASDAEGKKWPSEANITVGWGSIREDFQSRIYCVPGRIVEAVGGQSETKLAKSDIRHHEAGDPSTAADPAFREALGRSGAGAESQILTHLQSRWTLRPFPFKPAPLQDKLNGRIDPQTKTDGEAKEQTEVHLSLSFAFANPVYHAMSSAVTPKVAGMMIEAFENRVKEVIDGPGAGGTDKKIGIGEGVTHTSRL